jgi:hypothetical protein
MGVPASEFGYTSATTGRGDHEVHKGHVVALAKKRNKKEKNIKTSNTDIRETGTYQNRQEEVSPANALEREQLCVVQIGTRSQSLCLLSCPLTNCQLLQLRWNRADDTWPSGWLKMNKVCSRQLANNAYKFHKCKT